MTALYSWYTKTIFDNVSFLFILPVFYSAGIKLLNICYMKHSMSQKYLQRHIITNIFENVILSILNVLTASGMVLLLYMKHSQEFRRTMYNDIDHNLVLSLSTSEM